jgi:hypothetical protein
MKRRPIGRLFYFYSQDVQEKTEERYTPARHPRYIILRKAVSRKARQDRKGKTAYQALVFNQIGLAPRLQKYLNFFASFAPLREKCRFQDYASGQRKEKAGLLPPSLYICLNVSS